MCDFIDAERQDYQSFQISNLQQYAFQTYYGSANLTGKPINVTPTMRVMPYDGKPSVIGEPDLKAGNGCKDKR